MSERVFERAKHQARPDRAPPARRGLRHHPARRPAGRGRLGHGRGQAAHRRAARPPRRAVHRGRLAGRQPEGHRVLRPGRHRAAAGDEHARRLRLDPPPRGKVDDDATLRNLIEAGTSAVCIVAKSSDYHVTQALQTTLDEGEAMIADSVEYLAGQGRRVLVDMEHFFDGYKANPEFSLRALEAAVVEGRQPRRAVRHQRRVAAPRDRRDRRRRARPRRPRRHDRHPLPRRHRLRRRQLDGRRVRRRRPRPGHAQRARRAHRQRQPDDDHPQPPAQARLHVPARRSHRAPHRRQPPRRRAAQPGRQPAGAVRRLVGVRPQGRAAHQRHRPGQGRLRARRSGARRQRHPLRRQRDGRAGDDHDEGRRARPGRWTARPSTP